MAFAQGSRSSLSYIVESTYGTTPAGNFTNIPMNTHSINVTKERVQGNEIQADRMTRVDRHGNTQVGGEIVVDLRKGDFDPLIESAMFSTFDSADEITVGTTLKSFTLEDAANDINQFRLFTGCAVSSWAVSIAPNQMVTSTFTMVGKDGSISGTGKTITAASTNQPFDSYSGDLSLDNQGALTASGDEIAIITSVEFTVENSLAPTFVVGSASTPQLEYGRANVEGTISAYFEDASLYNRFINETATAFDIEVNDPTGLNPYTFLFPNVKFNGAEVPVENEQSRIITIPFVALYDSTEGTNLKVTRTS